MKNIYKRALVNTALSAINYAIICYLAWSWCLNLRCSFGKVLIVGFIGAWSHAFFSVVSDKINGVDKNG